jgi:hypothetical protein
LDNEFFTDSDSTLIDRILNNDIIINRRNILINRMDYMKDSDSSDGVASDSDNSTYIDTNIGTEEHIDIDEIDSDKFSDSGLESDVFSVTDDGYFIDNKEIRIIF